MTLTEAEIFGVGGFHRGVGYGYGFEVGYAFVCGDCRGDILFFYGIFRVPFTADHVYKGYFDFFPSPSMTTKPST